MKKYILLAFILITTPLFPQNLELPYYSDYGQIIRHTGYASKYHINDLVIGNRRGWARRIQFITPPRFIFRLLSDHQEGRPPSTPGLQNQNQQYLQ
jgi:hypothetical protein